ncbi:MAG: IclR family transcriptional regulator C-terminal domain-containing protein, partial [Casimicrobiaceae bacterium]
GDAKPLHSSAIGKAMLGALDEQDFELLLRRLKTPRVTNKTISEPDALRADIVQSHARGYFVTRGENVPDVMAIAITRRIGDQPYGIAIAGPIGRIEARFDAFVAALLKAGADLDRIEHQLRGAA